MALTVAISPQGHLYLEHLPGEESRAPPTAAAPRIERAFEQSPAAGLLHLAAAELQTPLPPEWTFVRDFASAYLTRLCHTPSEEGVAELPPTPPPDANELAARVLRAPPLRGLEYLTGSVLADWWSALDNHVREEMRACAEGPHAYLRQKNPLWRLVGRVTLHLAENKRDPENPFAFMATYAQRLSAQGRVQHLPLSKALEQYAGAKDRAALINLFTPLQQASESSSLVKELLDSGAIYRALAWTPREAHRFLRDIPTLEANGLIVRVPDWWHASRPPRPQVSVKVGNKASGVGVDALLDFAVELTLDGQPLTADERAALLNAQSGLVSLRGQWVEVDGAKLQQALAHWKSAEKEVRSGGLSFFAAMRLMTGASLDKNGGTDATEAVREWSGLSAGAWLADTLRGLTDPGRSEAPVPASLNATLRPYQRVGFHWLRFATRLRLGVCLADDMGLGKTIQVLTLLLSLREERGDASASPCLLVVPASLIANWKAEIARFAPSLRVYVAHPSEEKLTPLAHGRAWESSDLVITTYGMIPRLAALRTTHWSRVILDEAQAIKNSGARQTRAVKELKADARIALTGTPVENRLSDLWSIFDFLNPGLLGSGKEFGRLVRQLEEREHNPYGPLRALIQPYLLRRLKTDKAIRGDLPEKTEVKAFCHLTKAQAALYQQSVGQLAKELQRVDGIQRRGLVLAYLMRFKQICNHPSQWLADGSYDPAVSGKFQRLAEICEELAQRQEKALIFTQFREIADPLAAHLTSVFGRAGLVLHGQTALAKRRQMVESFQRDEGPPFFVLSLKAGGTGLNLTSASHVIHFDRWWNPAVENQATDRAFRIGQKCPVLVHKFVCRGTIEERIDRLIEEKTDLARQLVEGGSEKLLTEMSNDELLQFVALDMHRAVAPEPEDRSMRWFAFRPYVPVAKRRSDAAKLTAKLQKQGRTITPVTVAGRAIATTFWGKAWCDHLESYSDYANRLPRGRTYVRNGSVIDLQIAPGKITAMVSGSEVYHLTIKIEKLPPRRWDTVKAQCAGQVGSVLELLQGRFAKSVMTILTDRDKGLFPAPAEIAMKCSCPDGAYMCKHLAAVLYGVGSRLDHQPELLFVLRQADHLELLDQVASAGSLGSTGAGSQKTLKDNELADVFGIDLEPSLAPTSVASSSIPAAKGGKQATPRHSPTAQTTRAVEKALDSKVTATRSSKAIANGRKKATPVASARTGRKSKALATEATRSSVKDRKAPIKPKPARRKNPPG